MNRIKINISVEDDGNYERRKIYKTSIDLEKLRHILLMLDWEEEEIELEQENIIELLKED
jgi:hypothetical protein